MIFTAIIPIASAPKFRELFGEGYFSTYMSQTGSTPPTHAVSTGEWYPNELSTLLSGDQGIIGKLFAGDFNASEITSKLGLQIISELPENYEINYQPSICTAYHAKQIMAKLKPGSRETILEAINSMTDVSAREAALGAWESASYFIMSDPLVTAMKQILAWTDEDVNELFQAAWNDKPVFLS